MRRVLILMSCIFMCFYSLIKIGSGGRYAEMCFGEFVKYLRSRKILFVLLMVFQLVSLSLVRAEQAVAVFSEELSKGYNIKVKLEGDSYWIRAEKKEWVLLKAGVLHGGEAKPVLFLDADGDGVKDIFLKLFESGANNAYALFFAKLQDNNVFYFSESKEVFGSPYLNDRGGW